MTNATFAKFIVLSAIFTLALSVNYLFAAWTGPTAPPPGNNTPTPVNVGTVNQVKDGSLGLNGLSVFGSGYFQNRVGINVPIVKEIIDGKEISVAKISIDGEQALNLDVEGAVGAKYYCDEDGNNCVAGNSLGSGGGDGSGWVEVTSNTGPFNVSCEYKWRSISGSNSYYVGSVWYAGVVSVNTIHTASGNNEYSYVESSDKSTAQSPTGVGTHTVKTYERCN
jgi:hypothetical protein